jgi:hypothetical protein
LIDLVDRNDNGLREQLSESEDQVVVSVNRKLDGSMGSDLTHIEVYVNIVWLSIGYQRYQQTLGDEDQEVVSKRNLFLKMKIQVDYIGLVVTLFVTRQREDELVVIESLILL